MNVPLPTDPAAAPAATNAIARQVTAKHTGKVVATLQGPYSRSVDVAADGTYTMSLDGLPSGTYRVIEFDFPLDAAGNRSLDRDGPIGPNGIGSFTFQVS